MLSLSRDNQEFDYTDKKKKREREREIKEL